MRIISGIYRGRRMVPPPKGWDLRPTLDRVKESLFNILQGRTAGAAVLDLFAGTGGLGIEALSRGADSVVFCDISRDAVRLLGQNLAALKVEEGRFKVFNQDYLTALRALRGKKFDIIFLDPPYGKDFALEAMQKIEEYDLLNEGGIAVVEEGQKKDLNLCLKKYIIRDKRVYGSVALYFVGEEQ